VEWSDLDPRLGLRQQGGWSPAALADIVEGARARLERLRDGIERVAGRFVIAVCPPTLPLPPVAFHPTWRAGSFEAEACSSPVSARRWRLAPGVPPRPARRS
jgi:hypothetical protein